MIRRGSDRVVAATGVASSVLIYAIAMFSALFLSPPSPLRAIRTFAWHDQLGYLSMVANVADGDLRDHEPVTETGANYYPRAYYTAVGLIARVLHIDAITAWNLVSVLIQLLAVAALSICLIRVSRRAWMGFLAPLPFFAGVLSFLSPESEGWYRPLDSHAVLWGPYGALFSNNAEAAGLSIIVIAASALSAVWLRPTAPRIRVGVTLLAVAALGALSGFQTYSFLTGAYGLAYVAAAVFLSHPGRRWWMIATAATIPLLFTVGPVVFDLMGQLPALILGLLPAAPGLLRGLIRTRGLVALYASTYALAASPQILATVSGIRRGDPFLTYRVASNVDLGVARPDALVAALVVALPLLTVLGLSLRRRLRVPAAVAAAAGAVWIILSLNDVWGPNAEPYRFWIDCFLLSGVLTAVAGAAVIGAATSRTEERSRPAVIPLLLAGACVVVYVTGLADFGRFAVDPQMSATWNPESPRAAAVTELARSTHAIDGRLLLVDNCIDDRTVKATSGAPMPFYYLGMAWPENRDAVQTVMDARSRYERITAAQAEAAQIGWVLLDSACVRHVGVDGVPGRLVAERTYGAGLTLELRRLP